ncbi:MAG: hypothetical protein AAFO04_24985 [Cyanobacteria bacterium J06592_8]
MRIIGLDIGESHAVAAALDYFPLNMQRYYQLHKKEFVRLDFTKDGFARLWDLLPDGVVMEPTGLFQLIWCFRFNGFLLLKVRIKMFQFNSGINGCKFPLDRAYHTTQGAGISNYTRQHAQWVCENQRRVGLIKAECEEFISKPEF